MTMIIEAKPYLQDLFDHMRNEHGLILLQSEMQEIVAICNTDLNAENEKLREVLQSMFELVDVARSDNQEVRNKAFDKAKQLITEP